MGKLYLCDGSMDCNCSDYCYKNGGMCMHTASIAHSVSAVYPEFPDTYFIADSKGGQVEQLNPYSLMRTFMAGNPTPDLTRVMAMQA